jgi:hypothetical protein
MTLSELSRRRLFLTSAWLLTLNVLFYAAWQRIAPRLTPCNGKAIGVEVGLVSALIALVLAIFGPGTNQGFWEWPLSWFRTFGLAGLPG